MINLNKLKNLIVPLIILAGILFFPAGSSAQVCVDMLDYFNPNSGNANLISNGETFYNVQGTVNGRPGFYIVKNRTGEVYEEFSYDDQFIYHHRDTSWATEQGNVQCEGFDAGFTMVRGNVVPSSVDLTNYAPAPWVKRQMCEGEVMNSDHTIVGFKKDGATCSQCEAPFTGHTSFAMKFNRHYPTYEVGGSLGTVEDVVEIQILEGNGAGERFIFSREHGWIGFGRSSNITNRITATAPSSGNLELCALENAIPGTGDQCVGPINVDLTAYRGQVIGHQDPSPDSKGPWKIYASATDTQENSSDLVKSVIVERMTMTPSKFWHTDFSTMTQKFIGTMQAGGEDFIGTKAESQFRIDSMVQRSPPIYLTSHIPGYVHAGGFEIPAQAEKRPEESYMAFQARTYPSQDGIKPGEKSTIDGFSNTAFIGCLQAAVCDPRIETCLKNDKSGDYCNADAGDTAENCIGVGERLAFQMTQEDEIELLEPQDLQAMDKVMWDFSAAVVRKPGDSVPVGRSTIMATSIEEYYAKEQELIAEVERKQQEMMAGTIPNNLPTSNTKSSTDIFENQNPLNPKAANAQVTPPYETNQPYCQGANILIENKTEQNQYSVKIWNGQPNCPQPVDWGYYIEYWVSDSTTGTSEQIGSCGSPSGGNIHRSYGLPVYEPGTGDEREYGVPIETLPGCSIPITPRDLEGTGLELKVHFQITNSSAPATDDPACTQRPVCTCPNEAACGIKSNQPLPPLDCTRCEIWAPSGECATMEAEDLMEASQCAKGFCQINNGEFRLADDLDDPPTEKKQITVGQVIGGLRDLLAGFFGGAASRLFNLQCNESSECVSVDPATGQCLDEDSEWDCTFGERQYLLYGYVPGRFKGKLNTHRTSKDFQAFQALYKVPGVSESYFEPKPSKHELALTLGLEGGLKADGNKTPNCGSNNLASRLPSFFGFGGPSTCLDLSINDNDATRSMYIEYTDHYSQAAQYCLGEAAGSLPNNFPTRALNFCQPFMSSLRGGNFLSGAVPGGSTLDGGSVREIEEQSLQLGVPARLLATILEIEGGNQNSCFRPSNPGDTGTGPYQITDDLAFELTSSEEQTTWNIQRWPAGTPQSVYRADGRCDFSVATQLTARALKSKAGLDPISGTISETQFTVIRDALNGYYGQYNGYCGPTADTQGRWGENISYCDYGLWRMGLTQYCTAGQLSPTCDNVNDEIVTEPTPDEIIKKSLFSAAPPKEDPAIVEQQLIADIENLLDKYSKTSPSLSLDTPMDEMPAGFQRELENLQRVYQERYSL